MSVSRRRYSECEVGRDVVSVGRGVASVGRGAVSEYSNSLSVHCSSSSDGGPWIRKILYHP